MAETAFQTQYRDEFVAAFESRSSDLRATTTTNAVVKGNSAVFQVAGSGGAEAVTRGVNGLIPARADDLAQLTATLAEWHDLVRKTGFNVFASQGDQKRIMQMTTMKVINRKVDRDIIAQLDTATQDMGAAAVATLAKVMHAKTILGNAGVEVEDEDNMFALISPAVDAYLMQIAAYTSADYVDIKPLVGPARRFRRWAGFNWKISSLVTGVGTASEKCYFYHRDAIGHAYDSAGIKSPVGYDEEQDYSYARASVTMGSKLLQNTGVVQFLHDGSAYVAT